jgi:hypothetical protein
VNKNITLRPRKNGYAIHVCLSKEQAFWTRKLPIV